MNINNNVTPMQWLGYLKQIEDPEEKGHRYLVSAQGNNTYRVLTAEELKEAGSSVHKLSITEIIAISKQVFYQAEQEYYQSHGTVNTTSSSSSASISTDMHTLIELKMHITKLGTQLLAAQEKKRNQPGKQILRGIGWVASWTPIVGKSIEPWMQKNQEGFETQKNHLTNVLQSISDSEITKEVDKRLKNLPTTILEAKENIKPEEIKLFIAKQIAQSKNNKSSDKPCLYIFEKDMKRGVMFLRTDAKNKIRDKHPLPFQDLDASAKVDMGIAAIAELTEESENKPWENILQAVVSQTSLTALADSIKGVFVSNITSDAWLEGDKVQALILEFGDTLPPVHLEIIRNPHTSRIERVNIKVMATANILKKTPFSEEKGEMVLSEAVIAKLNYSINLTEFNQFIIDRFSLDIKSSY